MSLLRHVSIHFWRFERLALLLLLATLLAFGLLYPVQADMAPGPPPAGSNPLSGSSTQVQMAAETVIYKILPTSPFDDAQAQVTATFRMHNPSKTTETMIVGFPLAMLSSYGGTYDCAEIVASNFPPINDLAAWVNGDPVSTSIEYYTTKANEDDPESEVFIIPCWSHFEVTFPAGQDTIVKVTYTALSYRRSHFPDDPTTYFDYILTTGALWNGPIGSADIIFRFPYAISAENVWDGLSESKFVISGNDMIWHNNNFEPDQNISIGLFKPYMWMNVLNARRAVKLHPNDSEAWGQLGKAYKVLYGNGINYYNLSAAAYQKAISLAPNDAGWQWGYANLVCSCISPPQELIDGKIIDITDCLRELKNTLRLRPNYSDVMYLLQALNNYYFQTPDPHIFLTGTIPVNLVKTAQSWPTATGGPVPTRQIYITVVTPQVEPTSIPTETVSQIIPNETITEVYGSALNARSTETPIFPALPTLTSTVMGVSPLFPPLTVGPSPSLNAAMPSPENTPATGTAAPGNETPFVFGSIVVLIALGIWFVAARKPK